MVALIVAINALAVVTAGPSRLKALAVLLLAPRVLATAATVLVKRVAHRLFALDSGSNLRILRSVEALEAATSDWITRKSVLEAVAIALRAAIFVAIALNLPFRTPH